MTFTTLVHCCECTVFTMINNVPSPDTTCRAPRSFDVITRPPGEGTPTTDFAQLLTDMSSNCDYSLPKVEANVAA